MDKIIGLRVKNITSSLSRRYTLLELLELLKKSSIVPVGNLTNTSKLEILRRSLKQADPEKVYAFIKNIQRQANKFINKKKFPINFPLHKEFLGTKVEKFIQSDHLDEAVRVANIRVVNRVKKLSGLNEDGVSLVQKAFSLQNPILQLSKIQDEQIGFMHLFIASIFAFRNPPSHDDENSWSKEECMYKLHTANYLMNLLDKAKRIESVSEEKLQSVSV